jgi:hypothetical protein
VANNLDLSPDAQLSFALNALRALEYSGTVAHTQNLVPGIAFAIDPKSKDTVHIESRPGELMDIRFGIEGPGRWLSLAMTIGKASLAGCKIVGFVCKSDAAVATTFRACIRSGLQTGHKDVYFNKTIVSYPATSIHLDAMELEANPEIPEAAPWRELVLFFKREPSQLSLRDLRVFII